MTTCPYCNGTGEDTTAGPSINALDYIPCGMCGGTGREPVMVLSAEDKIKELEAQIELMKEAIADLDKFLDLDRGFPANREGIRVLDNTLINQAMRHLKSFIKVTV